MKILGIDPGIERLGWGIVEKNGSQLARIRSGVKKTSKNQKEDERLWEIFVFLDKLIKKEKPNAVSTEKLFFAKNVKTALVIGEVRGIILAIARKHHLPIKEFAPLGMKMAICGYGRADKRAVANMVKLMLNLPQKELLDDETDALALAIAGTSYPSFP
ncbi:crossover junction endodeoxyribonuclease RuvC [Candidatus Giovannonibacteria bacterium RIFCSPLOWO2_12_FULL_44_25]|uniref:Crossover junction endodeoxyribonuclease RuvC n=3 Tax=Candidatus Giovannoniibacteriota TaxID=1752738 RepID=A0A0G1L9Y7_9BACT|nr:MAG: RuvC [Parcubacteria group bacterium GW2011_GWC1_44_10]KKT56879.1 MAG: RuvC [Candidatus Giovannonibacteria bacterium GW2011_GWB1_44_23]KKT59448.1 MAG: RuvC [Candidatus Giovannonibacteria bacterium GW2011_GWA1_44_25]OGF49597.1 MAG: crossover junction endodeoxyribonuclease RuvC [Candidatus Giovannonibacteria bacterium GWA2_45_15]OGF59907.1 MAG: crossover junction endodeoxyribonuclease RuvC [Candidatus Giovannonibacteria bacterium RIFCSPHIGHO2_01_45_12]OGF61113.1 MAG: crossover junction en